MTTERLPEIQFGFNISVRNQIPLSGTRLALKPKLLGERQLRFRTSYDSNLCRDDWSRLTEHFGVNGYLRCGSVVSSVELRQVIQIGYITISAIPRDVEIVPMGK